MVKWDGNNSFRECAAHFNVCSRVMQSVFQVFYADADRMCVWHHCCSCCSVSPLACAHAWESNSADFVFLPFREQQRSWLYRIRPSVTHEPFHPLNFPAEQLTADFSLGVVTPNQVIAETSVAPMRYYISKHIQCKQRVCLQEIA
jgi:homogentisate 1,2-dioxygenase